MDPHPDAGPEGLTAPPPEGPGDGSLPPLPDPVEAAGGPATGEPEEPARLTWAERGAVSPADPGELAAARAEVLAARAALGDEATRLEAAARNAVDIKGKIRRNPVRAAGVAGGAAFVVFGGPRRVLRGVRRRIFGAPEPLPPSLLPDQIEKAVRALGDDGSRVRGVLEREFAGYLSANRKRDRRALRRAILRVAVPIGRRWGTEAVKRAFSAEDRRRAERPPGGSQG